MDELRLIWPDADRRDEALASLASRLATGRRFYRRRRSTKDEDEANFVAARALARIRQANTQGSRRS
jgi:hypothetical protein